MADRSMAVALTKWTLDIDIGSPRTLTRNAIKIEQIGESLGPKTVYFSNNWMVWSCIHNGTVDVTYLSYDRVQTGAIFLSIVFVFFSIFIIQFISESVLFLHFFHTLTLSPAGHRCPRRRNIM